MVGAGAAELEGAFIPAWLDGSPTFSNVGGVRLNVGTAGAEVVAAEVLVGAELVVGCPPRLNGEAAGADEVGAALGLLNMFLNGDVEVGVAVDGVSTAGGL